MRLGRGAGQRLDAAHARGDGALRDDLEEADIAGAPHMRAAAQLDREGPRRAPFGLGHRSPIETTRTSSPYFSPKSASAPSVDGVVRRHQPGAHLAVLADAGIDLGLDGLRRPRASAARGWLKSKRMRSGATSEPFCVTCSPRRRRSAWCSRCVTEWLARKRAAPRLVDAQLDHVADAAASPCVTLPRWTMRSPAFFCVSRDGEFAAVGREHRAGIAQLAARFGVERRLVDDDRRRGAGRGLGGLPCRRRRWPRSCPRRHGCRSRGTRSRRPCRAARTRAPRSRPRPSRPSLRRASARWRAIAASKPATATLRPRAAQHVLGEVERKAVGVVELERDLAREGLRPAASLAVLLVEQPQAARRACP